ncbi:helix-turn-helix domain-containing protein [Nocardia sp. CDC153]|uniref:TetR/AcrR family transcriptional regulator n=1 Tax=Nocardia sp. CDC153 TaxID=3112167 RepID=UPI002DB8293A|nr:helix-turn-helix domain-containing protein [Nocardia sp. CDC153]MEC3953738.1 helix-turn-helix domain-containing protein [Nocardia sp. CDC153]
MSAHREQILDAARDLIVRDGFAAASMHAIARIAGLTRPALYAEFGDRDTLFAALIDREERRVLDMAMASMPELPLDADPAEFAVELADAYLDMVLAIPQSCRFVLMPAEGAPPGTSERVERGKAEVRARGRALITMIAAAREREVDVELLSHAAFSVSETAALLVLEPDHENSREAVSTTLRWLARRAAAPVAGKQG